MGKKIKDRIKEVKTRIITESKDAHHAEALIAELLQLHKKQEAMNKLVDVPVAEINEELDFGAWSLHRTPKGILFSAKGGMHTFVEMGMSSVYMMLRNVFEIHGDKEKYKDICENYTNAVAYVFQCPIFSSLEQPALFGIATYILKTFNEYCETNFTNAEEAEYTEEDIKLDIEQDKLTEAIERIADAPLPPEEEKE